MKRTSFLAAGVALAVLVLLAADASAMYQPTVGRWLQRDPGPCGAVRLEVANLAVGSQYADGANLYQYVQSRLFAATDPWGLGEYKLGTEDTPDSQPLDTTTYNTRRDLGLWDRTSILTRANLTVAGGLAKGYKNAARHLDHFLGGSGKTVTINFKTMNSQSDGAKNHMKSEMNDAMAAAEKFLEKPGEVEMVTIAETSGSNRSGDWLYAVGEFRTWAKAKVSCRNGTYVMEWSYRFRDNYDWDLNNGLGGGLVTDREMALLHRNGLAREYAMDGRHDMTITWKKGERIDTGAKVDGGRGRDRAR